MSELLSLKDIKKICKTDINKYLIICEWYLLYIKNDIINYMDEHYDEEAGDNLFYQLNCCLSEFCFDKMLNDKETINDFISEILWDYNESYDDSYNNDRKRVATNTFNNFTNHTKDKNFYSVCLSMLNQLWDEDFWK